MIQKANDYIKKNKDSINKEYRLNYHFMTPLGWMNDPNGFSKFRDKYHLFYQFYPYETKWMPVYWGHTVTEDFIRWEQEEVALAPDRAYDNKGCFSGTALEYEGRQYLMYTAVSEGADKKLYQQQALAVSEDGIHFEKAEGNPVIPSGLLPETIDKNDFRDPKIWQEKGTFYCAAVARDEKLGGRLLLYRSKDLREWELEGDYIPPEPSLGTMWECPDIFDLDGKRIVIMSIIDLKAEGHKYWNKQACLYFTGTEKTGSQGLFEVTWDELDYGFDFYAPQTLLAEDGRRIMIAWMQAWEDKIPTSELGHGWAGAMTLPRELSLEKGILVQRPVREIENYRQGEVHYKDIVLSEKAEALEEVKGSSLELILEINFAEAKGLTIDLFEDGEEKAVLSYDKEKEELTFDRGLSGRTIESVGYSKESYRTAHVALLDNILKLRIFIDKCSAEIFAQDGLCTMTNHVYPKGKNYGIRFSSKGRAVIENLWKWDIIV